MTSTIPPPPPPPPRAADRVAAPARRLWRAAPGPRVLAGVVIGGVAFDLGLRHPVGLASFLALALLVVADRTGRWSASAHSAPLLALALLPGALLMVRASVWLVPLNLITALGLVLLAAVVRDEPHAFARAAGRVARIEPALVPAVMGFNYVGAATSTTIARHGGLRHRLLRVARGAAIALPVSIALLVLLATSDALFRSWIDVPLHGPSLLVHLSLLLIGSTLTVVLAGHGAWAEPTPPRRPGRRLGPTEATVILGGVVAVYAIFVVSQVVAITAGADYVLDTTGLTYAEYARTGFFQLVAAAVLTLLVLLLVARHRADAAPCVRRRIQRLELATVVLTLIVVAVAIRRLFLYEAEFGLTMLRLYTIVFAGFIGVVFLVVGAGLRGRLRRHPVTIVGALAFGLLLVMNIVNPEALVAQRNIDRFGGTARLDVAYLVDDLGPDALPTIMDDPAAAAAACATVLAPDARVTVFNWGRWNADQALDAC